MRKISFGFFVLLLLSAGMFSTLPFIAVAFCLLCAYIVVGIVYCQKAGKWEEVKEHLTFWEREDG